MYLFRGGRDTTVSLWVSWSLFQMSWQLLHPISLCVWWWVALSEWGRWDHVWWVDTKECRSSYTFNLYNSNIIEVAAKNAQEHVLGQIFKCNIWMFQSYFQMHLNVQVFINVRTTLNVYLLTSYVMEKDNVLCQMMKQTAMSHVPRVATVLDSKSTVRIFLSPTFLWWMPGSDFLTWTIISYKHSQIYQWITHI